MLLEGSPLYQWETGREIYEIPTEHVEFSNKGDSRAGRYEVTDGRCKIPSQYLQNGKELVVISVSVDSETDTEMVTGVLILPVKNRAKPKHYTPDEAKEAIGIVKELTAEAKAAVDEAAAVASEAEKSAYAASISAEDSYRFARNAESSAAEAKAAAEEAAENRALIVEWDSDTGESNYDQIEILQAVNNGRDVFFKDSVDGIIPLDYVNDVFAVFTKQDGQQCIQYIVDAAGMVKKVTSDKGCLIVTHNANTLSASHSREEILEAAQNGRTVYFVTDQIPALENGPEPFSFIPLAYVDEIQAVFTKVVGAQNSKENAVIYAFEVSLLKRATMSTYSFDKIDDTKVGGDAWSSKNIVDKLCNSFSVSGLVAQCESVEGYPVNLSFAGSGETGDHVLTVCGKNIYDKDAYPLVSGRMIRHAYGTFAESAAYAATEKFIPISHLRGKKISFRNAPADTNGTNTGAGVAFYTYEEEGKESYIEGSNKSSIDVPKNACYMRFSINNDYASDAQIEIGDKSSEFESYTGDNYSITTEAMDTEVVVDPIPGKKGITTFYIYAGIAEGGTFTPEEPRKVRISGRSSPETEIKRLSDDIEKLKSTLVSMGANI